MPEESIHHTEASVQPEDLAPVGVDSDYLPEPSQEGSDTEQDIVEVVGEPISRSEAFALESELAAKSLKNAKPLPMGRQTERVDPVTGKVLRAEEMLASGKMEDALVFAQDAAKDPRTAKHARLIIARAFMEQGENAKALSVLQAIPRGDETAESLYYRGLAAARLNRTDEAVKYLAKALSLPESDASRRAGCQALYDRIIQAREAKNEPPSSAIGGLTGARPMPVPRAKRRYRTKVATKLAVGIAVIVLLPIAIVFGLWLFSPENYASLRSHLPASWIFPPR